MIGRLIFSLDDRGDWVARVVYLSIFPLVLSLMALRLFFWAAEGLFRLLGKGVDWVFDVPSGGMSRERALSDL